MKKMFEVRIRTDAQLLPAFIELIRGEATLVSVTEVPSEKQKRHNHQYVNAKRDKGITSNKLALELLANDPMPFEKITEAFIKRGFASSTTQPTLSTLRRDGKVKRSEHGIWSLVMEPGHGT